MSEQAVQYRTASPLTCMDNNDMLTPELRAKLEDVRRKAISLLLAVESTLGEESSVVTRSDRRAR